MRILKKWQRKRHPSSSIEFNLNFIIPCLFQTATTTKTRPQNLESVDSDNFIKLYNDIYFCLPNFHILSCANQFSVWHNKMIWETQLQNYHFIHKRFWLMRFTHMGQVDFAHQARWLLEQRDPLHTFKEKCYHMTIMISLFLHFYSGHVVTDPHVLPLWWQREVKQVIMFPSVGSSVDQGGGVRFCS